MYELPEGSVTEQEGNLARRPYEMNAAIEGPAHRSPFRDSSADPTLARAKAAYQVHEAMTQDAECYGFDAELDGALACIEPIECFFLPEIEPTNSIFQRPHARDPFMITGDPLVLEVWAEEIHYDGGHHAGDRVYLMNDDMRDKLKLPSLALALHPGILFPNKPFIFPELRERRNSERHTRHISLAAALKTARTHWTRLWYDKEEGSFQHLQEGQKIKEAPGYPGFIWDCLNAIGETFYYEPTHPLQLLIRDQQRLHMAG